MAYIGQGLGQGQIQYFKFIATAGQTTFSGVDSNGYVLNYSVGFCDVFLNGRRLTPTSDYTATDGSTIVLQSAASVNDVIFVASASTFDASDWVTNSVNYVYTATAGQTTFTGGDDNGGTLSYVNGTILVSVNGINLPQTDYTATNGSTVILNSGVNAGDIVQIFSLRTMAVVNFLPLSGGTVSGSITVGNSTVNTQITAGNIALNGSTLLIGNSTSNVVLTGTTITISNSTSNASFGTGPASINAISTNTFTIGTAAYHVANGNFGIGSNSPPNKLHVAGANANVNTFISIGDSNNQRIKIGWNVNDALEANALSSQIITGQYGDLFICSRTNYPSTIRLYTNDTANTASERMRIAANGAVTIGDSGASGYGGRLSVTSPVANQASIFIWSAGLGSGQLGIATGSSNLKLYNTYSDGTLANGKGIDIDSSGRFLLGTQSHLIGGAYILNVLGTGASGARTAAIGGPDVNTTLGGTAPILTLYNSNGTTNNITKLSFGSSSGGETCSINGVTTDHTNSYGDMAFVTRGSGAYAERMRIDSSGRVTKPYQPFFHAKGLNTLAGTGTDVIYPTVLYNIGSHYNVSTGRFTAPIFGYYMFGWTAIGNNNNDVHRWRFRINGSNLADVHLRQDTTATGSEYATNGTFVFPYPLNAGDYVNIWYQSDGNTTPYGNGSASDDYIRFWGYLLG